MEKELLEEKKQQESCNQAAEKLKEKEKEAQIVEDRGECLPTYQLIDAAFVAQQIKERQRKRRKKRLLWMSLILLFVIIASFLVTFFCVYFKKDKQEEIVERKKIVISNPVIIEKEETVKEEGEEEEEEEKKKKKKKKKRKRDKKKDTPEPKPKPNSDPNSTPDPSPDPIPDPTPDPTPDSVPDSTPNPEPDLIPDTPIPIHPTDDHIPPTADDPPIKNKILIPSSVRLNRKACHEIVPDWNELEFLSLIDQPSIIDYNSARNCKTALYNGVKYKMSDCLSVQQFKEERETLWKTVITDAAAAFKQNKNEEWMDSAVWNDKPHRLAINEWTLVTEEINASYEPAKFTLTSDFLMSIRKLPLKYDTNAYKSFLAENQTILQKFSAGFHAKRVISFDSMKFFDSALEDCLAASFVFSLGSDPGKAIEAIQKSKYLLNDQKYQHFLDVFISAKCNKFHIFDDGSEFFRFFKEQKEVWMMGMEKVDNSLLQKFQRSQRRTFHYSYEPLKSILNSELLSIEQQIMMCSDLILKYFPHVDFDEIPFDDLLTLINEFLDDLEDEKFLAELKEELDLKLSNINKALLFLENVNSMECSKRGLLINGNCICHFPFYGESCEQEALLESMPSSTHMMVLGPTQGVVGLPLQFDDYETVMSQWIAELKDIPSRMIPKVKSISISFHNTTNKIGSFYVLSNIAFSYHPCPPVYWMLHPLQFESTKSIENIRSIQANAHLSADMKRETQFIIPKDADIIGITTWSIPDYGILKIMFRLSDNSSIEASMNTWGAYDSIPLSDAVKSRNAYKMLKREKLCPLSHLLHLCDVKEFYCQSMVGLKFNYNTSSSVQTERIGDITSICHQSF